MFASKDTLLTRPSGYNISRSVRLRSSASGYFSRTPASAGNRQKWTWSGWIKRGSLGSNQNIFAANGVTDTTYLDIRFTTSDTIQIGVYTSVVLVTTQVFRDPSAWYHIVWLFDTTQATASNRCRLFVNGLEITAFGTDSRATYFAQNTNYGINNNVVHEICRNPSDSSKYFDGYLTEINFIDGQALTPSSFGSTNAITGVWQPAKYTGTYGTNGFYLNFSDNSSNTATTIGKDYSGNGNNWTPNNISVTSGSTYDSMTDVPTLTSATAANYAVWNPLDKRTSGASTFANGNLAATVGASGSTEEASATITFPSSGQWYCEITCTNVASGNARIGIGNSATAIDSRGASGYLYQQDGQKYVLGTASAYGATYTTGDVIGIAFDAGTGSITFYKNNSSQGAITSISTSTAWIITATGKATVWTLNAGQQPFSYTPPSGYVALNTYNLPASTISNGATVMAATTYTGTGATASISNAVNNVSFKPDFVWLKSRSNVTNHYLMDSVRGASQDLYSNSTAAEGASGNVLTAFNTNGFSLGTDAEINGSARTYVGWQWQAGQGTTSSNTSGSITSTVSVNATAGFSIVTYTGTGANATVGHGLGVAPSMIITKRRSGATENWGVYHTSTGATAGLFLNLTDASLTNSTFWNNTAPTSTVFSVGSGSSTNPSAPVVAYCWAAVAGFSAFGKYTGNGSADGPFVFLGFRPRWVMVKESDTSARDWIILDTSRNTYNVADLQLMPNKSDAEATTVLTSTAYLDILSNGFKVRNTSVRNNESGATYIYAAFAENPTKFANAR